MLKQRIITAAILIPIVLAILFLSSAPVFAIATAVLAVAGAWEWSNLMELKNPIGRFLYLIIILTLLIFSTNVFIPNILMAAFIWWCFASLLVAIYPQGGFWWRKSFFWRGLMGIFVLVPCWVALNYIRGKSDGAHVMLYLLILIWGADTGAYFIGKKWGRHKLAPQVSPGKSLQGLAGALVCSIIIAIVSLLITKTPINVWLYSILLAFVTVIFSVMGDLFESMLKRQANLKDSGSLLPGHGGILDRVDSLTAAAPIFAYGTWLLVNYLN